MSRTITSVPFTLISVVLEVVLPSLVVLHVVSVVLFYSSERVSLQARPLCEKRAVQNCSVARLADGPLRACTTLAALSEATATVAIALFSSLMWGSLLLYYLMRERGRKRGRTVHLVGDEFARYMDHLSVSGNKVQDQVLREPRTSEFHG